MTGRSDLPDALAAAFLAGAWTPSAMRRRAREALAPPPRTPLPWLVPLVARVLDGYPRPPHDRPRELRASVAGALEGLGVWPRPRARRRFLPPARMADARPWPAVPALDTPGDMAEWLELDVGQLAWLADVRSWERRAADRRLRHYTYAWIARPGAPVRLLEQPKARLKAIQRRLLHELLVHIPAHDAAHGFVPGRSVAGHAARHVGATTVLRFDLEDFFVSLPAGRVYGVLRRAGYPEAVAHLLTGLTTNAVPPGAWADIPVPEDPRRLRAHRLLGRRLAAPHLPQGAPTSPLLANLCAFALDRRMAGLAARLGATYTRYADDLVLSGDRRLARGATRVTETVAAIAASEGLRLNARKTRVMPAAGRQSVTGIVVNVRPNVARDEYDRLKAILHNAARHGPDSQNRDHVPDFRAHLLGRIAWVASLHPSRGAKLRARFDAIAW
jgi:RNA-directed DNA polymerase